MLKGYYYIMILLFITAIQLMSCSDNDIKDVKNQDESVDFSFPDKKVLVGESLQFTNKSENIGKDSLFEWDFGDKTTSTVASPTHTYKSVGDYIVTLTLKHNTSKNTISKKVVISLPNDILGRASLKDSIINLNDHIMVCAHRGNHLNTPENSLKSITDAINNNIAMVELDIRQTKDGELVLMHDATIDRTTNGSGKVRDFSLKSLQQFNLFKHDNTITNETVPSLKQVLQLARGEIYIDLDIDKKADFNKVYTLVNQYGMLKQVMFYSSEFSVIKNIINRDNKDLIVMPIIRKKADFDLYKNFDLKVVQFNVNDNTLQQQLATTSWHIFRNAYVNTKTTPNLDNYGELNEVIDAKGSIVQTDSPIKVKSMLQSQNLND